MRAHPALLVLAFALCLAGAGDLPAQGNGEIFDSFAYSWTTLPGTVPGPVAVLGFASPGGAWKKVIWASGPGWPLVDYLPEHLDTRTVAGRTCLSAAVVPPAGPQQAAGGAEAITTGNYGFGSYRVCCRPTGPTPTGTGVCESFYLISSQLEIDIEFLSQHQGVTARRKGTMDIVVHEYRPGQVRASINTRVEITDFDPTKSFGIYGFDWLPGRVDFYVAGARVFTVRDGEVGQMKVSPWQRKIMMPTAANLVKAPFRISAWTGLVGWSGTPPAARTEFLVDWISYTPFHFTGDGGSLPIGKGGSVRFDLSGSAAHAGAPYLLLTSLADTDRGTPLPGGLTLPLDLDSATFILLGSVNTPIFAGFLGTLDSSGQAKPVFNLPGAQLPPAAVGTRFHLAPVVLDPVVLVVAALGNPAPVLLVP